MNQTLNITFTQKKEQLNLLMNISKDDFLSERVLEEEKELKAILETNDTLEDVDIKGIGSLEGFVHRAWLFEYKDRGYILWDDSNGHYSYFCSAEDFLYELELSDTFITDNI